MSEQSVPPSARDIERARKTTESPVSPLLVAGAVLLAARLIAPRSFDIVRSTFASLLHAAQPDAPLLPALTRARDGTVHALALPLLALAGAALAVTLLQTGSSLGARKPSPGSAPSVSTLVGALLVLGAALLAARGAMTDDVTPLLAAHGDLARRAGAATDALIGALVATGVVDLAIRRWRWVQALHKTPEEARRDAREDEGDPFVRRQRRAEHMELLTPAAIQTDWHLLTDGRAMVVVAWRDGMDAPRVVLHATGALHDEVLTRAEALALPRHHRPDLVRALASVRVGQTVPAAHWSAVAALIVGASPGGPSQSP